MDDTASKVDDQNTVVAVGERPQMIHRRPDAEREERKPVRKQSTRARCPEPPGIGRRQASLPEGGGWSITAVEQEWRRHAAPQLDGRGPPTSRKSLSMWRPPISSDISSR